jgi:hypothetical protein
MKVNLYTSEPANERFVRFLQSRPVAITYGGAHAGFTHSVACWLYQMGYLTPKQENAIEGIIRKTKWEGPEPLPPDLVDTGSTIGLIVTPGHVPPDDVIESLRAQVEAEGRAFGGVYIDPVHKSIEDGANGGRINREDKFLSSVVSLEIPFTGYHHTKEVRRESFSAATLNDAIAPLLRGRVTEYRFRAYNPGKTSNSWQIAGERSLLQS